LGAASRIIAMSAVRTAAEPLTAEDCFAYDDGSDAWYAVRGIPEYWIVDPAQKKVVILNLVEGFYDESIFVDTQPLGSQALPELSLTPDRIFSAVAV
jgi:hypothetical protein